MGALVSSARVKRPTVLVGHPPGPVNRECCEHRRNLKTPDEQGCEVAIHVTTGLQYVKDKRPGNVPRLTVTVAFNVVSNCLEWVALLPPHERGTVP